MEDGDIVHPHHLPPVHVDDLLVEQVALQQVEPLGAVAGAQLAASLFALTPPLMLDTEANGNSRSPDFVLTIRTATWDRSSPGCRATSRTRPLRPPDVSYTGAPSNSVSASVFTTLGE